MNTGTHYRWFEIMNTGTPYRWFEIMNTGIHYRWFENNEYRDIRTGRHDIAKILLKVVLS
jgi:hypothetical protein